MTGHGAVGLGGVVAGDAVYAQEDAREGVQPALQVLGPLGIGRATRGVARHQRFALGGLGDASDAFWVRTRSGEHALIDRTATLLEDTLVVWGGEFGRLPIAQLPADRDEREAGRDHNKNAFSSWLAGAGIRGGTTHGATDDLGLHAVEDRVSVPDWHATILHLLGLSDEELFVERNGFKEKLTSVFDASVVRGILS